MQIISAITEKDTTKLDVTKADKMMNSPAFKRMKAGDPRYADKTDEGNEFANAVRKAKAAGKARWKNKQEKQQLERGY